MEFKHIHKHCPACLSTDLEKDYLLSTENFMSVGMIMHSRCNSCGTVFVNPAPDKEDLCRFYQSRATEEEVEKKIARASADRIIDLQKREYFRENRIMPVKSVLPESGLVFDVGCGAGSFVKMMQAENFDAQGCDLSDLSLRAGREMLGLSDKDIFSGDVRDIPDKKFDLVSLWTVFEHLPDPEDYLVFVRDRIRADGLLLLEFPTVDSMMFEFFPKHFFWIMPPYHLFLYSLKGISALLERTGFSILKKHGMPKSWNFTEVVARKAGLAGESRKELQSKYPSLVVELDSFFDVLAARLGKHSSIQLICRKDRR